MTVNVTEFINGGATVHTQVMLIDIQAFLNKFQDSQASTYRLPSGHCSNLRAFELSDSVLFTPDTMVLGSKRTEDCCLLSSAAVSIFYTMILWTLGQN